MPVRYSRRTREPRIDGNELGPSIVTSLNCPLKPTRVIFSRIRPHDQDDITILDVLPMVGHRPSAKRGSQTGYRGAMSYAGLMVDVSETHGTHRLCNEIGIFVRYGGTADPRNAITPIDDASLVITFRKGRVP